MAKTPPPVENVAQPGLEQVTIVTGCNSAFFLSACMLVLRRTDPDRPRVFRAPLAWVLGPIAILGCFYLFFSLAHLTQVAFLIWNLIGVGVYLLYGRRKSLLALN